MTRQVYNRHPIALAVIKTRLRQALAAEVQRVNANISKLSNVAEFTKGAIEDANARADKLSQRAQAFREKSKSVFDRWEKHYSDEEKALADAENAINQLSNGEPAGKT